MTNPLLKAAGIAPDTPGHSAERELFNAAWACVGRLREVHRDFGQDFHVCCFRVVGGRHAHDCPLVAFDKAAKVLEEEQQKTAMRNATEKEEVERWEAQERKLRQQRANSNKLLAEEKP